MLINLESQNKNIHFGGASIYLDPKDQNRRLSHPSFAQKKFVVIAQEPCDPSSPSIHEERGHLLSLPKALATQASLDVYLGSQFSTGPYQMVALDLEDLSGSYKLNPISFDFDGKPIPSLKTLYEAYAKLFSSSMIDPDNQLKINLHNQRIAKFLKEKRLKILDSLDKTSHVKFNAFEKSFDSMRNLERNKCAISDQIRLASPKLDHVEENVLKTQFDLCSSILKAELTQVVTMHVRGHKMDSQDEVFHLIKDMMLDFKLWEMGQNTMLDDCVVIYVRDRHIEPICLVSNQKGYHQGRFIEIENSGLMRSNYTMEEFLSLIL